MNGVPLDCSRASSWYNQLGTIYQDTAGFKTFTIKENVTLGDIYADICTDMGDDRVAEALDFVNLARYSQDTLLGKAIGGTDLSGGEWQKLAIAHCYYRNRHIIILDEPTGNLDPLAEDEIFDKIFELAQDKTVIIITHHLSIAQMADRIIAMQDGRITEDGTHNELMEQSGVYEKLLNMQSKWYER